MSRDGSMFLMTRPMSPPRIPPPTTIAKTRDTTLITVSVLKMYRRRGMGVL